MVEEKRGKKHKGGCGAAEGGVEIGGDSYWEMWTLSAWDWDGFLQGQWGSSDLDILTTSSEEKEFVYD